MPTWAAYGMRIFYVLYLLSTYQILYTTYFGGFHSLRQILIGVGIGAAGHMAMLACLSPGTKLKFERNVAMRFLRHKTKNCVEKTLIVLVVNQLWFFGNKWVYPFLALLAVMSIGIGWSYYVGRSVLGLSELITTSLMFALHVHSIAYE